MVALPTTHEPGYRVELRRSEDALWQAELCTHASERFVAAHLAAMRVAVTVLGLRARRRPTSGPVDVWGLLGHVAPEFAEWAAFFAATRAKWLLVRAGETGLVSDREADDLLRDARSFHDEVTRRLDRSARAAAVRRA